VQVNVKDNDYTQQFTVAHEVGHLLLGSVPRDRLRELSHQGEELLCDRFARQVIVPPDELAQALGGNVEPNPLEVLRLCGTFEANPSTMLRALGEDLCLDYSAYLLARLRGHYQRPAVAGFRIDAATGPADLFWPFEMRIEKVGLDRLATAGRAANHGEFIEGDDERLAVRLGKVDAATGDNFAIGPARWEAVRQGREAPYLLARIDCSCLQRTRLRVGKQAGDPAETDAPLSKAARL